MNDNNTIHNNRYATRYNYTMYPPRPPKMLPYPCIMARDSFPLTLSLPL